MYMCTAASPIDVDGEVQADPANVTDDDDDVSGSPAADVEMVAKVSHELLAEDVSVAVNDSALKQDDESALKQDDESALKHGDENAPKQDDDAALKHDDENELKHGDDSALKHDDDSSLKHEMHSKISAEALAHVEETLGDMDAATKAPLQPVTSSVASIYHASQELSDDATPEDQLNHDGADDDAVDDAAHEAVEELENGPSHELFDVHENAATAEMEAVTGDELEVSDGRQRFPRCLHVHVCACTCSCTWRVSVSCCLHASVLAPKLSALVNRPRGLAVYCFRAIIL